MPDFGAKTKLGNQSNIGKIGQNLPIRLISLEINSLIFCISMFSLFTPDTNRCYKSLMKTLFHIFEAVKILKISHNNYILALYFIMIVVKNTNTLRDHSSITSSKRWAGGVRKWQFLMIYNTVNHQRVGWVGLKKSKT